MAQPAMTATGSMKAPETVEEDLYSYFLTANSIPCLPDGTLTAGFCWSA